MKVEIWEKGRYILNESQKNFPSIQNNFILWYIYTLDQDCFETEYIW